MSERFGKYSKYIIQERALPDSRDGLKPVQRRILYSMHALKLHNQNPYKKSARVVGDVIGKYHPHGDTSIYDAMIRMAQDWKMAMPLVQMHGNVGSIDDDPAAAMRYTESRLAAISDLMLEGIDKGIVKFAPNFDDTETEPTVLPAFFPNLLVNGSKGIASGFATEMPPHNLVEVLNAAIAKIKNQNLTIQTLMKYIKGPDFPTGGIIHGNSEIEKAFETGRGKIVLSSKYEIIKNSKEHYISITQIPYGVVKSKLVFSIDELLLKHKLAGVKEVLDASDRNGIDIHIKLEKDADPDSIMKFLISKTELQIYYNYNNIAIDNGFPTLMNLNALLGSYLDHFAEINTSIIKYDLDKSEKRLEIVEGFIKVASITDKVIKIIRQSENGKKGVIENLQSNFDFTLRQSTSIAEMQLYRLSQTDFLSFQGERDQLILKNQELKLLLSDENEFRKHLIKILKEIIKKYGVERKTILIDDDLDKSYNIENLIEVENVNVIITANSYISRVSSKIYQSNSFDTLPLNDDDYIKFDLNANTKQKLLILTNKGNYILIPVYRLKSLKWKEPGQHISEFDYLDNDEKIINVLVMNEINNTQGFIYFVTKSGMGKRSLISDFETNRFGKKIKAITLKKGDTLVSSSTSFGNGIILIFTSADTALKLSETELPILKLSGQGNIIAKLSPDEEVNFAFIMLKSQSAILISNRNFYLPIKINDFKFNNRNTKGQKYFEQTKKNNHTVIDAAIFENNEQVMLVEPNNVSQFNWTLALKKDDQKMFLSLGKNVNNVLVKRENIFLPLSTNYQENINEVKQSEVSTSLPQKEIEITLEAPENKTIAKPNIKKDRPIKDIEVDIDKAFEKFQKLDIEAILNRDKKKK
ncbi:DNA topoisomerase (ATP-hydrolyzing) [Mycoplasma testudineum]